MFSRRQPVTTGNQPDDTAAIEAASIKKLHANIMNLQKVRMMTMSGLFIVDINGVCSHGRRLVECQRMIGQSG